MTYVWNAENRLIEAGPTTPATNDKKVEFKYDYMGRRVEKKVSIYTGGQWVVDDDLTQRFVYDGPALDTPGTGGSQGWNVVLVLDGSGDTQRTYTWGLDLSGTMQGAGGIGGLLAAQEVAGTYAGNSYWLFYDGNGNVGQLLNADDQTLAAHYEYAPYGNIIVADDVDSSDYVSANPFRFSTKWFDDETGMGNWGLRYLLFRLGRWANRDPIEEAGGLNLYAFVRNDPQNLVDARGQDYIGRLPAPSDWSKPNPEPPGVDPGDWAWVEPCNPNEPFSEACRAKQERQPEVINNCAEAFFYFLDYTRSDLGAELGEPMCKRVRALPVYAAFKMNMGIDFNLPCSKEKMWSSSGTTRMRPDGSGDINLVLGTGGFNIIWTLTCSAKCGSGTHTGCGCCCQCSATCNLHVIYHDEYTFKKPPDDVDNNVFFRCLGLGLVDPYTVTASWDEKIDVAWRRCE